MLCQVGSGASVFPPLLWSCSVSVGLRFSFPLPFQGLPAPGQVCWCVFALSLFFCVPLLGSRLSNLSSHLQFHFIIIPLFILIFTSCAKTPPCQRQGACVERLHRRKTSLVVHHILYYIKLLCLKAGGHRGPGGVGGQRRHPPGPVKTYLLAVALDGGDRSWALQ